MSNQIQLVLDEVCVELDQLQITGEKVDAFKNVVKNIVDAQIIPALYDLAKRCPSSLEDKDPLELFQEALILFKDELTDPVKNLFDSKLIQDLLGHENAEHAKKVVLGIIHGKIDLEKYAKAHWSLQDLFEGVIYPLLGGPENAWKVINTVYSDTYYTGLNYNHVNGKKIQGEYTLLDKPTYEGKYDFSNVEKGDIVFSDLGFALADHFSGHCAIVDGWVDGWYKKDDGSLGKTEYLRVIEANQYGVSYGLLDDTRIENDHLSVLKVHSTKEQKLDAVQFCNEQLGKNYNIPIFLSEDVDPNASAWYCSELVWAGYMNQGIDIQSNDYYQADIPGILPWEIFYSSNVDVIISYNNI